MSLVMMVQFMVRNADAGNRNKRRKRVVVAENRRNRWLIADGADE